MGIGYILYIMQNTMIVGVAAEGKMRKKVQGKKEKGEKARRMTERKNGNKERNKKTETEEDIQV